MVARSAAELQSRFDALSQRKPGWTVPIGIVMVLMCVEAFMGSPASVWNGAQLAGVFAESEGDLRTSPIWNELFIEG